MKPFHLTTLYRQYVMVGLVAVFLCSLLGLLVWTLSSTPSQQPHNPHEPTSIETVVTRMNPQEIWVERLETEAKETRETVVSLEKKLGVMEKMILESIKQTNQKDEDLQIAREENRVLLEMQKRGDALSSGFSESEVPNSMKAGSLGEGASSFQGDLGVRSPQGGTIKKIVLNFSKTSKKGSTIKKTLENTLPAGTFAGGILLGGVDASTSIQASADPRPILVRLINPGTLPRGFLSDVKDCHVLASSYGDLSSERVYMRLEKLTCTERLTGEIIETQVAGYISGEDGKAGVRGTIVDKSGEAVRASLVGGFFSGISQFMGAQQQRSIYPVSPFGQTNALGPQEMLGAGASNGMGNALEKYADFFIKRAEQLQPVIQVAAGRQVDVVFTQGTFIGDSTVKKALGRLRDDSRRQQVTHLEEKADEGTWLPSSDGSVASQQENGL